MVDNAIFEQHHEQYLEYLRALVQKRSDFMNPDYVMNVLEYCEAVLTENLTNYTVYRDKQNNLIAVPKQLEVTDDIVYFNAHIDTVGANENEWDAPFHPWNVFEDENSIVARGVSDCKAGVALQLFLSWLIRNKYMAAQNTVFSLTFKEEGGGIKTASEIGAHLGHDLPLSKKQTYIFVFENTVSVKDVPLLSVYLGERSNYVVSTQGTITELQAILKKLAQWNPVSIEPISNQNYTCGTTVAQQGGHVCSVPRQQNALTEQIENAQANTILSAGDRSSFAVVPSTIEVGETDTTVTHRMTLTNRSFDSLDSVYGQLKGIDYETEKDFQLSTGYSCENEFYSDKIYDAFCGCQMDTLDIDYTFNIGASDATRLYCSLNKEDQARVLPIVVGPGSRSQRNVDPPRLTHGKNETYDKASGWNSICYLIRVLEKMNFIHFKNQ